VPENVRISYRGANYAIGQGPHFYGIWHAASLEAQPLEWWPQTPQGWAGAWARFTSVEVPGTIAPVAVAQASSPEVKRFSGRTFIPAALLALGIVLGVVGLFPSYVDGVSLASQSQNLVLHVIFLAAWAASAALILLGGNRTRAGSLLGIGVSAVTFGLFLTDAGTALTGGNSGGAGLALSSIGWLACTVGAVVALRLGPAIRFSRPSGQHVVPVVTLVLAALGAAIAFAPSWDSFTLHSSVGSQTITAGNAFANPGLVIVGNVATMIAIVAVIALAAAWRPTKVAAALVLGAAVTLVAEAISAIIQVGQGATPEQFGVSQSQAAQIGLVIHSGLTPIFWVFCAFVGTVVLMSVWMLVAPESAAAGANRFYPPGPHPAAGQFTPAPSDLAGSAAVAPGAAPSPAPAPAPQTDGS